MCVTVGCYLFLWLLILILLSVALLSTFYAQKSIKKQADINALQITTKSFDLVKNYNKLIEIKKDDVLVFHVMRSMTAMVVIHAHTIQFSNAFGMINGLDVEKDLESPVGFLVKHIDVGIDHFTVMSGVLLMKSLMDKEQNLIYFLIKRYIRLIGPVAVMMFYFVAVSPFMGSGPLWSRLNGREQEACVQNWWMVPLMCQLVYWYIPCDFHLAVFGTMIFFIFKKNRTFGWIVLVPVSIYAIIVPSWTTYWEKLPIAIIYDIEKTLDFRKNEYFLMVYIKSHQRAGRYLIGMGMGYYMSTRMGHNRILNTKWSTLILTLNIMFGLCTWVTGSLIVEREYDALESAVFACLSNVAYAVCLCITFFICEYGSVPLLDECLKLSIFRVLSRLSYCIYLVHIAIVQRNVFSMRGPGTYDFSVISDGTGIFVFSVIISFAMWMLVEAPLTSLSNMVFGTRKIHNQNGHQNEFIKKKQL